ncbi:MAG: hypothetical protein IK083_01290 [Abditibacteriota bacterium]|nr:hypothetical protein [Abditibacteriota bacterium]
MNIKRLPKKTVVIAAIACGVFLLWMVSYLCIKAGIEKKLSGEIENKTHSPARVRIYSDMFSIFGGRIRKANVDITTDNNTGYVKLTLSGIRINARDPQQSNIGKMVFDIKVSENTLLGIIKSGAQNLNIQMSGGYVTVSTNQYNAVGVLQASGPSVYLRIVRASAGGYAVDPSSVDKQINPIISKDNLNFKRFEYLAGGSNAGFYVMTGEVTRLDGLRGF